MTGFRLIESLKLEADSKIILLVMDGLGGLPIEAGGPTELEAANTPNLDRMAREGTLGQTIPVAHGVTPGSGPAHLSLFGYDPITHDIGRGVLEATGLGITVNPGDVAARGNFCTVDADGKITDRRAGRIPSEQARPLVERLSALRIEGARFEVEHVKEYRFALILRGNFAANIEDTDPQVTGVPPLAARASDPASEEAAALFNAWIAKAKETLAKEEKANCLTLRGFSTDPNLPKFTALYGMRAACIATYPMYKGVSRLVGMDVLDFSGEKPEDEFLAAADYWDEYDFFFVHVKQTDSRGEDGDFAAKAGVIESVDAALPTLLDLDPTVLAVTGDHSTPARLRTHSWHPVPFLLWAPSTARPDSGGSFGESTCARGGLGTFHATDVMPLLMAHASRLEKFGA